LNSTTKKSSIARKIGRLFVKERVRTTGVASDAGNSRSAFPTTHWSEVARAGGGDPQLKREALGRLLTSYLPVFRAHLQRRRGVRADDVDDLLQGFICDQIVLNELIAQADERRGQFRAFLLVALNRYVSRVKRDQRAQKRAPPAAPLQLDAPDLAEVRQDQPADAFDLAWAREVIDRAIEQMRRRCEEADQKRLWEVFERLALVPLLHSAEAPSHLQVMEQLGLASVQQVANTLVTGKRMFARVLRSVVGEYAANENEIEEELRDLFKVLSAGRQI
jgi:hypothetical protein